MDFYLLLKLLGAYCILLRVYYIINNINSLDSIYSIIAQWDPLSHYLVHSNVLFGFYRPHTTLFN